MSDLHRFLRRVAWGYAAVMVVVVLALAGQARAATAADLVDRSEGWVAAQVGEPIPDREFVADGHRLDEVCQPGYTLVRVPNCAGLAELERIVVRKWVLDDLADLGRAPRGEWWSPTTAVIVVHEQLHHPGRDRRPLDEGVVDAVALDLAGAWARQVAGVRLLWRPEASYPREVQVVRLASARAAGAPWTSARARGIRRAWWRLDSDERLAVITSLVPRAAEFARRAAA